jgi:pimeloyl-ACP methyl ester carboxylesterase
MNIANALAEVSYRTVRVDDLDIFYREAGPKDGPAILLLHGLPSSSRMYQPLLESDLANQYHLVAPDYPGFGHSSWPDPKSFAYTFDHLAQIIEDFTEQLHLEHYTLFMQDYGGPVGFRMALAHPERARIYSSRIRPRASFPSESSPAAQMDLRLTKHATPDSVPVLGRRVRSSSYCEHTNH